MLRDHQHDLVIVLFLPTHVLLFDHDLTARGSSSAGLSRLTACRELRGPLLRLGARAAVISCLQLTHRVTPGLTLVISSLWSLTSEEGPVP